MTDAELALIVFGAEQMHSPPTLEPALHPSLKDWTVRGYVTGRDAILRSLGPLAIGDQKVYYGVLLEQSGEYVLAIRGTDGLLEWAEDGEAAFTQHPAGRVESGFWGVYQTLQFRYPQGLDMLLIDGIKLAIGKNPVTVIGHSLGAALATYLAYELAPGASVKARFFASPRPGDAAFAKAFDARIADYRVFAYMLDVVTHIPVGFGYCPLLKLTTLTPTTGHVRVRWDVNCAHHASTYAALLDENAVNWALIPPEFATCIIGVP